MILCIKPTHANNILNFLLYYISKIRLLYLRFINIYVEKLVVVQNIPRLLKQTSSNICEQLNRFNCFHYSETFEHFLPYFPQTLKNVIHAVLKNYS